VIDYAIQVIGQSLSNRLSIFREFNHANFAKVRPEGIHAKPLKAFLRLQGLFCFCRSIERKRLK
jgi:hypothetical protein